MKDLTITRPFSEDDYNELLQQAVAVIETSRMRIAKEINTIAMSSYWEIGKLLDERKVDSKHGDSIVKRLSIDLKAKYPDMGLSPRNLWNMKRFYLRYCQCDTKVQQAVALLPLDFAICNRDAPITATACRSNSLCSSWLNGFVTVKSFIV